MQQTPEDTSFLSSTRGKLVRLLRRSSHTVEELAERLGLTDNAIRAQLTVLERDGLVQQQGQRRSRSKPATLYALTPAAEGRFPKAYGLVLHQLLETLTDHLTTEEIDLLMRTTGRRLAALWPSSPEEPAPRLERALALLDALGGLAELEQGENIYIIRGYRCPLAAVVPGHPEVCHLLSTMLSEVIGTSVQDQCDGRKAAPCCFIIHGMA
ncbi:helix-turn-helix transcriptional regulator [Ktedonobacter racemifer]|uniref:Putative transcriptional regulator n=1 Tax=Ktedonobacter racemifer DSM 44963 TaxID=485913 RepID=D6TSU3_KTERA|nr:helix-turn-helix domain-containing protein [Ktedonobacter racemifer]EFH83494.1 putative transcriptional regulator [Ktedonobacter racemifer DSM 44963]